ncbi:MAG TPA: hypothetical protein VJB65_05110 [Patescibacteria group bacterium]|nr:hypothetical protein [Patescibacteria group bacterium]
MKLYTDIFRQSWHITKKQKAVWWFGLFALFLGGKGIDFESFFSSIKVLRMPFSPLRPDFWNMQQWNELFTLFGQSQYMIFLLILAVPLGMFLIYIMMVSQIGLVDAFGANAQQQDKNTEKKYLLEDALQTSRTHLPTVFAINVVSKVLSLLLLVVVSLPMFIGRVQFSQVAYSLLLFFIVAPIIILISLIAKYAVNYAVLQNMQFRQAVVSGLQLFWHNVGVSIELAVLMFVGYFVVNILAILGAALITLPVYVIGMIGASTFQQEIFLSLYALSMIVALVILVFIFALIFSAWHFGNWTLLFLQLTKGNKQSKIYRLMNS